MYRNIEGEEGMVCDSPLPCLDDRRGIRDKRR
jgi:hypothetical protein